MIRSTVCRVLDRFTAHRRSRDAIAAFLHRFDLTGVSEDDQSSSPAPARDKGGGDGCADGFLRASPCLPIAARLRHRSAKAQAFIESRIWSASKLSSVHASAEFTDDCFPA